MTMRKLIAEFLCALMLFHVFPATITRSAAEEARAEEVDSQPIPLETGDIDEIEVTPSPLIDTTLFSGREPPILDEEQELFEGTAPEPVEETAPPTAEPTALIIERNATEGVTTPVLAADTAPQATTEPPALSPTPEPTLKEGPVLKLTSEPMLRGNPSKSLPAGAVGTASKSMMAAATIPSALTSSIALKTPEYINLAKGDTPIIRVEAQTSGGNGQLLYAFDLYRDETLVDFMPAYGSEPSKEFTMTQPGRYHVLAFVYENATGTEQIRQSGDTGVSMLEIHAIVPNTSSAIVGEIVTWAITTDGASGNLQYKFTISYETSGHSFSIGSGKLAEDNFIVQVPLAATYRARVDVFEPDIHSDIALSIESIPGDTVKVTNPDGKKVEIVSVKPDKTSAMIGEEIVWTVGAEGGTNVFDYRYRVYAKDTLLFETGWVGERDFWYTSSRSGIYRVDVSARNRAFPSDVCSMAGESAGVSGLSLVSVTADKSAAYTGDSITWSVNSFGGSGTVHAVLHLQKDGKPTDEEIHSDAPARGTFLLKEPGIYQVKVSLRDDYTSYSMDSGTIAVTKRPGATITKTEAVSGSSVIVTWKAVTGATGYELWRSTIKTGTYTKVYTGTALSRTDTGRNPGVPYYYKVLSYKTVYGIRYDGDFGLPAIAVALAKPATPTASVVSRTSVKVSWAKVAGASGYELWRSTSVSGTYTRVYRGTALSFINKSLTTNRTCYYKLKAYKLVGTASYYSPLSAYKAVTPR